MGARHVFALDYAMQQAAWGLIVLAIRSPRDLVRRRAPHRKVTAQRHRAARDRDLRRDSRDLSGPRPSLQLLDAVGVHPETAAAAPDVAAAG